VDPAARALAQVLLEALAVAVREGALEVVGDELDELTACQIVPLQLG
jgi:hypothetical protein